MLQCSFLQKNIQIVCEIGKNNEKRKEMLKIDDIDTF